MNVVPLIVAGSIASLKVAVTRVSGHAPLPGVADTTVGTPTPVQAMIPVVKVHA